MFKSKLRVSILIAGIIVLLSIALYSFRSTTASKERMEEITERMLQQSKETESTESENVRSQLPKIFPHPSDPSMVIVEHELENGERKEVCLTCPEGLVWNPETEMCDFPEFVKSLLAGK